MPLFIQKSSWAGFFGRFNPGKVKFPGSFHAECCIQLGLSVHQGKKNPKYLNIDKASPTEECSGRGTLTHQFLPGKHHGIHSFTNPGATGTSCDYTPGVPRDSTAASATWGGKTAPRDVLSSQQKLSLDILQLFLTLPKEDSLRNLPQRKQSRNYKFWACGLLPKPPHHTNTPCAPNDRNTRNSSNK